MKYGLTPEACRSVFAVPNLAVDNHIKLASAAHLRVLLWFLRNSNNEILNSDIESALNMDPDAVSDAIIYWTEAGILCSEDKSNTILAQQKSKFDVTDQQAPTKIKSNSKHIRKLPDKPGRIEVAERGLADEKIRFMLNELQVRFGRELRQNELSTFIWLYDTHGMDIGVIIMLSEYAISTGKANIGYIESTAIDWINSGVDTVIDAEKKIADINEAKAAWHIVETAMGIDHRKPSDKELEMARKWVNEWNFGREILKSAYNVCIDSTAKLSMAYINKVLGKWHSEGVKTPEDISKNLEKNKNNKNKNITSKNQKDYFDLANKMMFADEDGE